MLETGGLQGTENDRLDELRVRSGCGTARQKTEEDSGGEGVAAKSHKDEQKQVLQETQTEKPCLAPI